MKFTLPVSALINPISQVASICTANTNNPDDLSQYLYFSLKNNVLTLIGTDNTVQLKAELELPELDNQQEVTFLLDASRASTFIKSLGTEDSAEFDFDDNEEILTVVSAKAEYQICARVLPHDSNFPIFDQDGAGETHTSNSFKIGESKLRYMLDKSTFCISHDNYRDYLKGARFEVKDDELALFCIDGHRMAVLEAKLPEPVVEPIAFLMTLRGVTELQKLLQPERSDDIELKVIERSNGEGIAMTKVGIYTLANRLLKCTYPNVRSVFPSKFLGQVELPLDLMKIYVNRISAFTNKRIPHINLYFEQNKLTMQTQNSEREGGTAILNDINFVPAEGKEPRFELTLNSDFLKKFLSVLDCEKFQMHFADNNTSTVIRPSVDEENNLGLDLRYIVSHIMR